MQYVHGGEHGPLNILVLNLFSVLDMPARNSQDKLMYITSKIVPQDRIRRESLLLRVDRHAIRVTAQSQWTLLADQ